MSSSSLISSMSGTSSSSAGTGLDVGATVDQLIYTEQAPERLLQQQQASLSAQASALRDINGRLETLESSMNSLKDLSGAFGTRSVESSNDTVLSGAADASAAIGNHTVTIAQLATVSSQYSDPLASPSATFTPGSLQFRIGGGDLQAITFDDPHNSLTAAAQYINGLGMGVSASVVSDAVGSRLTLVSKVFRCGWRYFRRLRSRRARVSRRGGWSECQAHRGWSSGSEFDEQSHRSRCRTLSQLDRTDWRLPDLAYDRT